MDRWDLQKEIYEKIYEFRILEVRKNSSRKSKGIFLNHHKRTKLIGSDQALLDDQIKKGIVFYYLRLKIFMT